MGPVRPTTARLTKRFLMELDAGTYLVSGVGDSPHERAFAEYVAPADQRQQQWDRARAAMADQRQCEVYASEEQFHSWVDTCYPR